MATSHAREVLRESRDLAEVLLLLDYQGHKFVERIAEM